VTQLRPIVEADLAFLERQRTDPDAAGEYNWWGYRPGRLVDRVRSGDAVRHDGGQLAIADDAGNVVGEISWRTALNGPPPNGECWELGIWIAPEARGKGHGTTAQRMVVAYLFTHTRAERVQAGTEAENGGEQKALEKAGFTREGVLRRACFRDGQWRDMVLYSKLRGE
jgi:RimJ/RimL family protein N-acetyltransferase